MMRTAARMFQRLRTDEAGAQTAEYAMLGGVSAAACGALLMLLRDGSFFETLVGALLKGLTSLVGRWF